MTPGEYATLGGSVLPLPPDGGTSHSQQVILNNKYYLIIKVFSDIYQNYCNYKQYF